jgi:hypothetical protein
LSVGAGTALAPFEAVTVAIHLEYVNMVGEAAERIIADMPNRPEIQYTGSKAFYSSITDRITLPPRELFSSAEQFYATAFYETVHSSGSEKTPCAGRDLRGRSVWLARLFQGGACSGFWSKVPLRRSRNLKRDHL